MEPNEMTYKLGEISGKLDLVIGDVAEIKVAFNSLEAGRLSRLERDFANLSGRISIIAALASLAGSVMVSLLINFTSKYL
mgnify:FL=1